MVSAIIIFFLATAQREYFSRRLGCAVSRLKLCRDDGLDEWIDMLFKMYAYIISSSFKSRVKLTGPLPPSYLKFSIS